MLEERYPHERTFAAVRIGILSGDYSWAGSFCATISLRLLRTHANLLKHLELLGLMIEDAKLVTNFQ